MNLEPSHAALLAGTFGVGLAFLLWRSGCSNCGNGAFGFTILIVVLLLVFRSGGGPPTRPA